MSLRPCLPLLALLTFGWLLASGCSAPAVTERVSSTSSTSAPLLQSSPVDSIATPGDYDGDGCVDISVKGSNGVWYIDFCANNPNGYVGEAGKLRAWDAAYFAWGDNTAIPVPADYDGDGRTDLAIKDATGTWTIDYSSNGLGTPDVSVAGYGSASVPVPADYDGDGKADLAVKDSTGFWGIDYASDGFGAWNLERWGYGDSSWVPVPGNYDGNGHCSVTTSHSCSLASQCPASEQCYLKADIAEKHVDSNGIGTWYVDYSRNGFGRTVCVFIPRFHCFTTLWDASFGGYGDATVTPAPADYDGDGYTDLSIKDGSGTWYFDYAAVDNNGNPCTNKPCFGGWNGSPLSGYGSTTTPTPGYYTLSHGTSAIDLAVKDNAYGDTLIDLASDGLGAWNADIANDSRPAVPDSTAPYISSTQIQGPGGGQPAIVNSTYQLTIGIRYTVRLYIMPGDGEYTAGVETNPALQPAPSLVLGLPPPHDGEDRISAPTYRRFSLVCTQPGTFALGFRMRDTLPPTGTGNPFNPDYGTLVHCNGGGVLHGQVTARTCSPPGATCGTGQRSDGPYVAGAPIVGATVSVTGLAPVTTGQDGYWAVAPQTGVPLTVRVSANGYSDSVAVHAVVPGGSEGGLEVDTPLEEPFFLPNGVTYTTYIDYSRGRTIMHTVRVDTSVPGSAVLRTEQSGSTNTLVGIAGGLALGVVINGSYFDLQSNQPVGYFFGADSGGPDGGYIPSVVPNFGLCSETTSTACTSSSQCPWGESCVGTSFSNLPPNGNVAPGAVYAEPYGQAKVIEQSLTSPLLSIAGTGSNQTVRIIQGSETNFLSTTSTQWAQVNGAPIWDNSPRDGISDISYGAQCWPVLTTGGSVISQVQGGTDSWARTAVGVAGSVVYLVVADGEGVDGGNGATLYQLGTFFRDVLGATDAMNFDGGKSSEMVLLGRNSPRHVNTLTRETFSEQLDPYTQVVAEAPGHDGSVGNYLRVHYK